VVLRGRGRMTVDDEIVELKEWDAVCVPPDTWRGYEAGPKGLEILVVVAPRDSKIRVATVMEVSRSAGPVCGDVP
jgi:quercetin dioxygenase-like cupin family protein